MGMNRNLRALVEGDDKEWKEKDWEENQDIVNRSLATAKEFLADAAKRAASMERNDYWTVYFKENPDEADRLAKDIKKAMTQLQTADGYLADMRKKKPHSY